MTLQALGALAVTGLALGLFIWNRLRPDVVALLIATLLILTGLVTPREGVSGFANEATVTVALLLVLSTGLVHTGAVDVAAAAAVRLAGKSERRLLLLIVALVMPLSAFINNTAAVAILLPAVLGATRQVGATPSRLLLPLSFASQLGGMLTLIGTSTNLLVAGLLLDLGLERIRIFDITLPALFVAGAGGLYLLTVGRWLTPHRPQSRDLRESYELHDYLTALRVGPDSPLVGQSIRESRFGETQGLQIIRIERRGGPVVSAPGAATLLRAGDLLLVEGKIPDIARIRSQAGVEIEGADPQLIDPAEGDDDADDPLRFAEVMVPPRSRALGVTMRGLRLRSRYDVSALALRRHAEPVREPLGDVPLQPGDILLVQARRSALRRLHEAGELSLLGSVDLPPRRRAKMKWALLATAGAVLLAAFDIVPIMVGAMAGVVVLFVTRVLTPDEAYEHMDWMVVVLLGAILPLGIALEESGAAAFLADGVATVAAPLGPYGLLAAVYLLTLLLTNAISNVAAAALMVPLAAALAQSLALSPMPFAVAVMFAASNAFLTPIGYQTNLFVYGPGGYTFGDFLRLGTPLSLITAVTSIIAIPAFLPFQP
ncbi:MAG TPA: SLC13 family permease [Longimicrobiales bacterium]|nr:SLC13 family permease [Longimicrobiales bacterium]